MLQIYKLNPVLIFLELSIKNYLQNALHNIEKNSQ
jgi:hypothetical protein